MSTFPKTVKPIDGQHVMVILPNYWGKGETLAEAVKSVKDNGGKVGKAWLVYSVDPSTSVNEMGYIVRTKGTPAPVALAKSH